MPGSTIIKGQGRVALFASTTQGFTGSGGAAIGVYEVGRYARLAGLLSIVGSATLRYQMGVNSSAFQVSSSFTVNSGGSAFDVLNYGHAVNLSFTQAASQANAAVLIYGEPIR